MRAFDDVRQNFRVHISLGKTGEYLLGHITSVDGKILNFVAGWNEGGKEHVSVSLADRRRFKRGELPSWDDMCLVKDIFWGEEEEVFQIHPPRSCYVDLGPVLHLWRAKDGGEIHAEGYRK